MDYPIDAVIAWVDGNDPAHRAKRQTFSDNAEQLKREDVGGDIRFTSVGEIKYCVASLLRYAPFLRKIFIVTDKQDPQIEGFVQTNFPDRKTQIELVDHKVIYRDYDHLLPVFNSLSIETVLWRIPDLSEHFIYLNDDFMLVAPTRPEDFFLDGKAICYAQPFSLPLARLLRKIKPKKNGHRLFGFKDAMINACDVVGHKGSFPYIGHIPLAQRVSVLKNFFEAHPEVMKENMKARFRVPTQFNPQVLCYILGLESGDCVLRPRKGKDLYLKPKDKPGYVQAHLDRFDRSRTGLFCCFNSLDLATPDDQERVIRWLQKRMEVKG